MDKAGEQSAPQGTCHADSRLHNRQTCFMAHNARFASWRPTEASTAEQSPTLPELIDRITPENQHIPEQSAEPVHLWALVEQAAKLLEWCPVCSVGSSGYIRQENLRRTLKKFGKEHGSVGESPAPATGTKNKWSEMMGEVRPCGHTNAQHMYAAEGETEISPCEFMTKRAVPPESAPTVASGMLRYLDITGLGTTPIEIERVAAPPEPATFEILLAGYIEARDEYYGRSAQLKVDLDRFTAARKQLTDWAAKLSTLEQALRTAKEVLTELDKISDDDDGVLYINRYASQQLSGPLDKLRKSLSGESKQ